jgi:hypothetical protein
MRISRLTLCAVIAAASALTLCAQQDPSGFHRVACVKVKAGMAHEFRQWAAGDMHKYAQSRANSGGVSSWYLLSSVIPQGESAQCDYIMVSIYAGVPTPPMERDDLVSALKQAGISATAQEWVDKRDSMITLISNDMFRTIATVGSAKKGDYFIVNYMKVSSMDDYIAYEKKVWVPFAEALAKDGARTGWSLNERVFPSGANTTFQAVTVDIVPNWKEIFQPSGDFANSFRKAHPDMELGTTFEQYEKLRTIISTNVFHLDDLVSTAK